MNTPRTCPICSGTQMAAIEPRTIKVGRWSATVDDEFLRCSSCGEETYLAGQMRATQQRAARAIQERRGILSPERVRAFRESYGLTQNQLERLLNVGPKTVVRWERGTVMPNAVVSTLVKILEDQPEQVARLAMERGVVLRDRSLMSAIAVQVTPAGTVDYQMFTLRSPPFTTNPPGLIACESLTQSMTARFRFKRNQEALV